MAEGLTKQHVGTSVFIQSAGVGNDKDIDGFAVAVCEEVGVELTKHQVRSFEDLENWGDDLESYDLIIALSPLSIIKLLALLLYIIVFQLGRVKYCI